MIYQHKKTGNLLELKRLGDFVSSFYLIDDNFKRIKSSFLRKDQVLVYQNSNITPYQGGSR